MKHVAPTMRKSSDACPNSDVLHQFLTDELDDKQADVVAQHIDACESCQSELDDFSSPWNDDDAVDVAYIGSVVHPSGADDGLEPGDGQYLDQLIEGWQDNIGGLMEHWKSEHEREESSAEFASAEPSAPATSPISGDTFDSNASAEHGSAARSSDRSSDSLPSPPSPIRFPGEPTDADSLGTLEQYDIQAYVGSGATGHLFKAWDRVLKRTVAIKVLRHELAILTSARERFVREAHAAARLQSDYIAAIHEIHTPDDFSPWLVLQFIEGESLDRQLRERGSFAPADAVVAVSQILRGLRTAHAAGIVHRDIKPANVLHDSNASTLRLVDFGLARLSAERPSDLTSEGVIAGTPAYMSPEQILDAASADERADVYSTGVVLYELLSGERPFRGPVRTLLQDAVHTDARPVRDFDERIPRDLQTICQKAMSRELDRRYQTAQEFLDDLQRFQSGQAILARPVSRIEKLLLWARRSPYVAGLSAILCVLLLSGLYGWAVLTLKMSSTNSELADTVDSLKRTNAELTVARQQASDGETRAVRHAEIAEQQLNIAFEMVSALVFEVQTELAATSGTEKLRRRLLDRAISGLDRVSQSAADSTASDVSSVMARVRLGDTLLELQQSAAALQQYNEALRLSTSLAESTSDDTHILHAAILANVRLADALQKFPADESAGGESHTEHPSDLYSAALRMAERWHALAPNQVEPVLNLSLVHLRLASLDDATRCDHLRQAVEVLRTATKNKTSPAVAVERAIALSEYSRALAALTTESNRDEITNVQDEALSVFSQIDLNAAAPQILPRIQLACGLLHHDVAQRSGLDAATAVEHSRQAVELLAQAYQQPHLNLPVNSLTAQLTAAKIIHGVNLTRRQSFLEAHGVLLETERASASDQIEPTLKLAAQISLVVTELGLNNVEQAQSRLNKAENLLTSISELGKIDSDWLNQQREQLAKIQNQIRAKS